LLREAGSGKLEADMDATLKAEKRDGRGKNEARRLRAGGRIPAVVYGAEKGKAVEISVDPKSLLRILHSDSGVNTLIGLQGFAGSGGSNTRVLVKEYQLDPIGHKLLHADFYQVAMDKALTITVPVVLNGEAKGVKQQGGIVDFVHREIEIEVLPGDIPENITVDISELMLNQGFRVRDLQTEGAKWKPTSDPDMMIVHVVAPKAEEVAVAADAVVAPTAPAEPEVIKKGKPEKAEDEKPEKKKT
jgi:large subunit ribosomal protein L25